MTNGILTEDEGKVVRHDEFAQRIKENEEKLANHEERLIEQDKIIALHSEQIKNIENSSLRLENLVMTENRETRSVIMKTNQELHTLINNLLGYKAGENDLKHKSRINTVESVVKIVSLLAGSGGLLYYIFGQ